MKHNFTRDQIEQAVIEAAKKRAGFSVDQMVDSAPHNVTLGEVGDLRAFLNALPDQSYPQIEVDDVRKGDRVMITTKTGNQYEVTVDRMDSYTWRWNGGSVYINAIENVCLIERPVKHPDPNGHPVIIIRGGDIYDGIPMPQDAMWTGTSYESRTHSFQPGDITDWSPAKVVADDDC